MLRALVLLVLVGCEFPDPRTTNQDSGPGMDEMLPDENTDPPVPCPGDCQLIAASPAIAKLGDTIYLEGTFGSPIRVHFPGGVTATAERLGDHRARVVVPPGAARGTLSVETGGTTVGDIEFQATRYTLGLGTFSSAAPQSSGARELPQVSLGRFLMSAVKRGDWIYVLGGATYGGGSYSKLVERARIGADDSLGPFAQLAPLTTARASQTAVLIGNYIYVIGGDNPTRQDSIERAQIMADGSLGAWEIVPTKLPVPATGLSAIRIGNRLYVAGGNAATGHLDTIHSAEIAADGSLGPFVANGRMTRSLAFPGLVVIGDYLYILGGAEATGNTDVIQRAPILPDGTIGDVADFPVRLRTPRLFPPGTAVQLGDYLYCIEDTGTTTPIERAPIAADGTLGAFQAVPESTYRLGRSAPAVVVIGRTLYAIGGARTGAVTATVERAHIDVGGDLGAFTSGPALATPRHGHSLVATPTRLAVVGGYVPTEDASVPIQAFASAGASVARDCHATAVARNFVYVIGGFGNSGTTDLATIERAPVNADGTLGAFTAAGSLTVARACAGAVILGNQLYVLGGRTHSTTHGTVERATINSDGSLGTFALVSGVTLVTPRSGFAVAVEGASVYIGGGSSSGANNPLRTFERADITGTTLGTFAAMTAQLLTPRYQPGAIFYGGALHVVGGGFANVAMPTDTIERSTLDGATGFSLTTTRLVAKRQSPIIALGDELYVVGGDIADPASGSVLTATVERAPL